MSAPVWLKSLGAASLLALFVTTSVAQEPAIQGTAERRKALLEGTHVFRRILHDSGCTALESFEQLSEDPTRTILIIFGDLDRIEEVEVAGGLKGFVQQGGAVLLASDRPMQRPNNFRQVVAVAGVWINGQAMVLDDGQNVYKGMNYCPLLQPARNAQPNFLVAPGKAESRYSVATNVPSYLDWNPKVGLPDSVRFQAVLPAGCRAERVWGNGWNQPPRPFLVAGDVGDGRVIVAADHSIFINEMMLPDDVQNVEFSQNCVSYLRGEEQTRDRVLLVDEFGIQTKFDVPLRRPHLTPDELIELLLNNPDKAIALADHVIQLGEKGVDRLERRDAVNDFLDRVVDRLDRPPGQLFAVVAALSTVLLCFYGMFRLGVFARFRNDVRTPPLSHAVGKNQPPGPLTQQRTLAVLRTGRLNEPAAQLARRWLLTQNLPVPDASSPGELPLTLGVGWWAGRGLRRRLRRVWLLAAGRWRQAITPAELWRLQRELEALAASRQRGEWTPKTMERGGTA